MSTTIKRFIFYFISIISQLNPQTVLRKKPNKVRFIKLIMFIPPTAIVGFHTNKLVILRKDRLQLAYGEKLTLRSNKNFQP